MKNGKAFLVLAVLIIIAVAAIFLPSLFSNDSKKVEGDASKPKIISSSDDAKSTENKNEGLIETGEGIIYTGKVVPIETRYYIKNPTKEFNQLYVKQGDVVKKGDLLFTYNGSSSVDNQIEVIKKSFNEIKVQQDTLYTKLAELKSWLSGSNEEKYSEYLRNEISKVEAQIATLNLKRSEAEDTIRALRNGSSSNTVESDIDGLVYSITDDSSNNPLNPNNAYITILSTKRKVRISVSEYEYNLFKVGENVEVKIESTNKTYQSKITAIDLLPNNLNTSDASNYNIDIEIDDEVPYGYSAIITVKNHE